MRILLFVFIFLAGGGCISPLDLGPIPFKQRIVIDGLITDQFGQHDIKLTTSAPVNNPDSTTHVSGALISLYDDLGNRWNYAEVTDGTYRISDFQAIIGRSYHIEVQIDDGSVVYRSTPQRMTGAGELSAIHTQIESYSHGPANAITDYSFMVTLDAKAGDNSQFLRWRTAGTFEYGTHPELATKPNPLSPMGAEIPDPYPCSGYSYDEEDGLVREDECTCCECWVTEYSSSSVIADNSVTNATYNKIYVATIPVDKYRFYKKYHLLVEQMSVSEDVYRFWQRVKAQEETGSIFQANISKVKGNVYNASDPEDVLFGVFAVSAVTSKSLVLLRGDAPVLLPTLNGLIVPCYQLVDGATTVKPPFW